MQKKNKTNLQDWNYMYWSLLYGENFLNANKAIFIILARVLHIFLLQAIYVQYFQVQYPEN